MKKKSLFMLSILFMISGCGFMFESRVVSPTEIIKTESLDNDVLNTFITKNGEISIHKYYDDNYFSITNFDGNDFETKLTDVSEIRIRELDLYTVILLRGRNIRFPEKDICDIVLMRTQPKSNYSKGRRVKYQEYILHDVDFESLFEFKFSEGLPEPERYRVIKIEHKNYYYLIEENGRTYGPLNNKVKVYKKFIVLIKPLKNIKETSTDIPDNPQNLRVDKFTGIYDDKEENLEIEKRKLQKIKESKDNSQPVLKLHD